MGIAENQEAGIMRATKAIIRLDRFIRNMALVRSRIGAGTALCVPVKADAYGHGAVRIGRAALEAGAQCLGVATVDEGAELRNAGITAPILLFSQVLEEEIPGVIDLDLSPLVSDRDFIREVAIAARSSGKILPVHLKIDTGMGRLGCRPGDAAALAAEITGSKGLRLAGTATHLARSDSPGAEDRAATEAQLSLFREALAAIRETGIDPGLVHAANSGGVTFHAQARFDMVRPGILLYGYSPGTGGPEALPVEPVMELLSRVSFIKEVKKGERLSYGGTWTAPEDTLIGTLPVGYADGLPRLLSGGDYPVLIQGRLYPLAGRICMDQCLVNLGPETEVRRGDEVLIFGAVPALNAGELGARIGMIPYEITCGIGKRVPRIYPAAPPRRLN
jgi:alanine racemase